MAKKKNGGTNLGLIITLIFFVLTTVILGVTTYMGYSEIDKYDKEKKDADKLKAQADSDAKYQRMQNRVLVNWIGRQVQGVEAAEIAREKKAFEDGSFPPAAQQKDKEEVLKLFKSLDQAMPWDAGKDTAPPVTYDSRIAKLGTEVAEWKAKTRKAEEAVKTLETAKKDSEEAKDKEIAALKTAYDVFSKKLGGDLQAGLADIGAKRVLAAEEGKKREDLSTQKEAATRKAELLEKKLKDVEDKLVIRPRRRRTPSRNGRTSRRDSVPSMRRPESTRRPSRPPPWMPRPARCSTPGPSRGGSSISIAAATTPTSASAPTRASPPR